MHVSDKVQQLMERGVKIINPASVYIDESIDSNRIAKGATIWTGSRILGEKTSIGPSCVLGEESPVTVQDCQLADNVRLKGGYYSGSVFLSGASTNSCAHIRAPVILEEQASCAHSVGLKQTILMPFGTLGSLVNFCDCLMAGGTDRKNHSEIGSSFVHFNYTPHQDKATASLIGDVPRGVLMDQRPIFLGGQGGIIGPVRIEYGTITAAGTICRKDVLQGGKLLYGSNIRSSGEVQYDPNVFGNVQRIVTNNLIYIGNLHALYQWYHCVRSIFLCRESFGKACHQGAVTAIELMINERTKRLSDLAQKIEQSHNKKSTSGMHEVFIKRWPKQLKKLELSTKSKANRQRDNLLKKIEKTGSRKSYLDTIQALSADTKTSATEWLQSIVDSVAIL